MKRRSILLRLVVIQMLILQVVWAISGYVSYRSALTTETGSFDRQQAMVAKGLAGIAENLAAEHSALLVQSIQRMEQTYREAFEQSAAEQRGQRIGFRPVIEVWHKDGTLLYRSAGATPFELDIPSNTFIDKIYQNESWHFYSILSDSGLVTVIMGESLEVRKSLFRPPLAQFLTHLLIAFGIFLFISWLALRVGLRPLRQMARELRSRSRLDLRPFAYGEKYFETRPLVAALNDLMRRVATLLQHEKAFLADAAHELRTPITAVRTQLHVLLHARDDAERAEVAQEIEAGLDRASSLTHQLITMARVDSEAYELQLARVDLAELAQDCIANLAPLAMRKKIDISYFGPTHMCMVGDAGALQSILNNLLENAIKYVPPQGQIEVQLQGGLHTNRLVVRDDGPGIPPESAPRLFERFYRVPNNTSGGSGLGLAIVKKLVERHDGSIFVVDGLNGRGVGFEVMLPSICSASEDRLQLPDPTPLA